VLGHLRSTLALVVAVTAAAASAGAATSPVNARTAPVIDQRGVRFTIGALAGRYVLVTFVATRCADACPMVNALFARMQGEIERRRLRLNLVTLPVDPQYDTPFVMARLAQALDAHAATWRLASGSVSAVQVLLNAFNVAVEPDERGVPGVHSTFVYLLDERGALVRTYPFSATLSAAGVLARR
jgi:protein SCO1/2